VRVLGVLCQAMLCTAVSSVLTYRDQFIGHRQHAIGA
jgi:hypothetical protein